MTFSSQTLTYIYHASHHISNPSINLSCISSYLKPYIYHPRHYIILRQKHRHGCNQTTSYRHLNIKNTSSNQACSYSSTKAYSKQMHVHMNAFLTSLHHNTYSWSYHMHVHGISNKEMKLSPNLTCKGQTTNKHGSRDS